MARRPNRRPHGLQRELLAVTKFSGERSDASYDDRPRSNSWAVGETGSLTSYEMDGLNGELSLADGHAVHEWENAERAFTRKSLFAEARARGPIRTAQAMISEWWPIADEPSAQDTAHVIASTASISVDVVAAAAKRLRKRVMLLEPTFDNLPQIMEHRGVELLSVPEASLHGDPRAVVAGLKAGDALFIVDPNNPTGNSLDDTAFDALIQACACRGVDLIQDCTFRLFDSRPKADRIGRLQRANVGFVIIEDTGKTWPTLEIKASPIFFSAGWRDAIESVFGELFLLQSPWAMQAFADLFRIERATGFPGSLHALVDERRTRLRALLARTPVRVASESAASRLPVEWLDISALGLPDVALVRLIAAQTGVHLLPGRQFFWARGERQPHDRIRVSLLRQQHVFDEGLARLEAFFDGDL